MVPTGTRQGENGNIVSIDYHFELHFDDGNHKYVNHTLTNGPGNPQLVIEVEEDPGGSSMVEKLLSLQVDTLNPGACTIFDVEVRKGGTVVHNESHQADTDCGGMGGG